jgi:hypothetical protein
MDSWAAQELEFGSLSNNDILFLGAGLNSSLLGKRLSLACIGELNAGIKAV